MKVREGFVSNSSTSSFIVAVDDGGDVPKVTIQIEVDIARYADATIRTQEELDAYMIDRYAWGEKQTLEEVFEDYGGDHLKIQYEQMQKAIQNGKVVLAGGFSNEGMDAAEWFLADQGIPRDTKGVDIIYNVPGF